MKELKNKTLFNNLYWRLVGALLILFLLVGVTYTYLISYTSKIYFQEATQRLNSGIAEHIVKSVPAFTDSGEVNHQALEEMFHNVMTLNPAIEIYLLDTHGQILSYFAPNKKIKLKKVSLAPIYTFIKTKGTVCVMGDDPRHPTIDNVFSASAIEKDGVLQGYMYVVLVGEEVNSVTDVLLGTYLMRLGTFSMLITLLGAFLIGLFLIWLLTKNLRKISNVVDKFKSGDFKSRINGKMSGEFGTLAQTFNEMADTLVQNIEQLKSLEKLRSELIANISHDLRTPIAVIHGYAETLLLKDNIAPEDEIRYKKTILSSSDSLHHLVNELFEFSKLEARQILPQKEPFFITELINDSLLKYQLIADNKNIVIKPIFSKNIPMVLADIAMIDRVLQNLLDNAIKFTPAGGSISVELLEKINGVEIKISDSGIGISEEELPFIFDRYHKNTQIRSNGIGLGLAIVKKILELHDSVISVKSKINKGTSFIFHIQAYSQA